MSMEDDYIAIKSVNAFEFKIVYDELKRKGILVAANTIRKYQYQGWMSTVFTVESNIGLLIILVSQLIKEHRRNKVWEKFSVLANLFKLHPEIPTAEIYSAGLKGEVFILVQSFLNGSRAGKRVLNKNVIIDEWRADREVVIKQLLTVVAKIHKVKIEGFGWPIKYRHKLKGSHNSWKSFFQKEVSLWIQSVRQAEKRISKERLSIERLKSFSQKITKQVQDIKTATLIHGDAINPSNIIINRAGKIYLLDWEWAIAGDPAWEFCDLGWWPFLNLDTFSSYFDTQGIITLSERKAFLTRVNLYIPFWLLWGMHMHANDDKLEIYLALRSLLIERMK